MSLRATWLTWRIHRFEVVFMLGVAAVLAISAWVIASRVNAIGLTEACWPRTEDGDYATPACDAMMQTFWGVTGGETGYIRIGLTVAPMLLGLILGAPIVARELELRTAGFSWALTPRRGRWLLARFLPMLLVGALGLAVMAWAGTTLYGAMWLGRYGPDLTEVSAQSVALVARGLMAVALGLLVGSLVGRAMPALLVAAVLAVVWGLVVVPAAQGALAQQRAVWTREDSDDWRNGDPSLTYADYGTFDPALPGVDGEPGGRVDQEAVFNELEQEVTATCGPNPEDDTGESAEYQAWAECADSIYSKMQTQAMSWSKIVPRSAWGDFVVLDVGMSLVAGGAALLLTFPVVARRRPE